MNTAHQAGNKLAWAVLRRKRGRNGSRDAWQCAKLIAASQLGRQKGARGEEIGPRVDTEQDEEIVSILAEIYSNR